VVIGRNYVKTSEPKRPSSALDRRRALRILATSPDGRGEAVLFAHGFTPALLADLVRGGLAIRKTQRVGRWQQIDVARLKITEAGRRVLSGVG
jgi:hypothetical protein